MIPNLLKTSLTSSASTSSGRPVTKIAVEGLAAAVALAGPAPAPVPAPVPVAEALSLAPDLARLFVAGWEVSQQWDHMRGMVLLTHLVLRGLALLDGVEGWCVVVDSRDFVNLGLLLHESFIHLDRADDMLEDPGKASGWQHVLAR